jgi:D-hydroxyproline dehydrogenase subunit gamma
MNVVTVTIDGRAIVARTGVTVAAAMINAGVSTFRHSVTGEQRAPVCGMGICHECRVTIDGIAQRRACMELVRDGMEIRTNG